jgi:Aldo/keto reductase family
MEASRNFCRWVGKLFVCLLVGVGVTIEAYSSPLNRRKVFDIAGSHVLLGSGLVLPSSFSASEGPNPLVEVPVTTLTGKSSMISIPRVGYSLYKTEAEQVPLCVELALAAGVKHIDVASQYGTNDLVGKVLKSYISKGQEGVPDQPSTKLGRRQELFVSHKLSNEEQSDQIGAVKKAVKKQLKSLQLNYLDLCSIHSPLTDPSRRLGTYNALLELQNEGLVRVVGVCNYGVNPLRKCRTKWYISLFCHF